jgi:hypothetical protein
MAENSMDANKQTPSLIGNGRMDVAKIPLLRSLGLARITIFLTFFLLGYRVGVLFGNISSGN